MASLLDWLKKRAEGVVAQINPFDNGATYNSVVNNRSPQQQAQVDQQNRVQQQQQAQQQRQQVINGVNQAIHNVSGFLNTAGNNFARSQLSPDQYNQLAQSNNPLTGIKIAAENLATPTNLAKALGGATTLVNQYSRAVNPNAPTLGQAANAAGGAIANAPGVKQLRTLPGVQGAVTFANQNLAQPILNSETRLQNVLSGKENYATGIKGLGQYASDVYNVGSPFYTAASGAKFLANPGVKTGAVAFLKGAGSGAGIDVANQLGQGKSLNQLDPTEIALSAATGGGVNLLPGVASLATGGIKKGTQETAKYLASPRAIQQGGYVKLPELKAAAAGAEKGINIPQYIQAQTDAQKLAEKAGSGNFLSNIKNEIKQKGVDALAPIETPINKATGGFASKESLALRNQLDRSLRADTIAGQYAKDNGLHELIQNIDDPKAFNQYLIAKRSAEVSNRGITTGRNAQADAQLVKQLAPKYEAQAQQVHAYTSQLLDKAVNYGLVSKQVATKLKAENPNYIPLNRIFGEGELQNVKGVGGGKASLSTQTVVQNLKGSEREIQNPLESILAKTHDVIAQGERNKAAQTVASMRKLEGNPLGLRELGKGEAIGTKPTISFLDKGVKRTFETTPEVANAAKNLTPTQLGLVGKILSYPTRILRLGATGVNVGFAAANVAKDTVSAFINSSHSLKASPANPRVFLDALAASFYHGGKNYAELVREGAGGTSFDIARDAAKESVKKIRAEKNVGTKALYTVTHPGELLRAVEDTIGRSEEFGRAVQYFGNKRVALAQGKGESLARTIGADAARNNTVNFARAGEYGRVLNSVLPYLNAGIQGSRTLVRNLKERPAQTTTKLVLTAFLPVATVTAWNLADPERKKAYNNIGEYEKQNNIIIVPPNPKQDASGRWNVIKIPISQEISNLNNIVRNGVENMAGNSKFDFAGMAGDLFGTATSLNAQNPNQLVGQLTPQAVKPVVETVTNTNLFTGQNIVPDALKNLAPQDQIGANTSGTAKVLGQLTGISPMQIDNAIRTSTGGAGQNAVNLSDKALAAAGVIKPEEVKGQDFLKSVTNRFDSAQGLTPVAAYFKSIEDQVKSQKLAGKDYELLNGILAKEVDASGKPIPQNDKDALNKYSILANNPRVAAVLAEAAKNLAKQQDKPVDPLYNLPPDKQEAFYKLNSSIYKGQAYERLQKENQDWLPAFQKQRAAYFDSLNLPNPETSGKVAYPLNNKEQQVIDSYFSIQDPSQRSAAIQANPQISDIFNKLSKYANDKQIAQGSAPLDTYPSTNPQVQAWTKEYFAQPKGSKVSWQRANPDKWAAVSEGLAAQSLYGLENEAVQAQYKDTGFSQKGLKDIYSLGQYNIAKQTDANGNTFYALGGSTGGFNSGGSRFARSGGRKSAPKVSYSTAKYAKIKAPSGIKVSSPKVARAKLPVTKLPKLKA